MQQHTKFWLIPSLLMIGLAGCGNGDEAAVQDRRNDETIPIGYYSNENHDGNGGNAILLEDDNDGPATETLDHTLGREREMNRQGVQKMKNNSGVYKINKRDVANDGEYNLGSNDKNYHGHLNNSALPTRQSYYTGNDGKLSDQITSEAKRVENVKDARTVIQDKNIIVGVLLKDKTKAAETSRNIKNALESYADGRTVKVMTNESQYNRIKVINNDLRNGGPNDQLNKEIKNLNRTNLNTD